jgi:hypothetical protein
MAAIENTYRSSVSLKLNSGISPISEKMIIRSCSLGKVAQGADAQKVMNVAESLAPVLEYPLVRVERTEVSVLENA